MIDNGQLAFLTRWVTLLVVLVLLGTASAVAAQSKSASQSIERFNGTLIESMKQGNNLGFEGRYDLLDPVIRDTFALTFMAKTSAGRYWRDLTDEQKKTLVETYSTWSIASYAGRFDSYSGQKFEMISETSPESGAAEVVSRLVSTDGEEVDFHFKLRQVKERWLVIDIRITGVSQLALTRSQFTSVLKKDGFDALIETLNEKIAEYRTGKN